MNRKPRPALWRLPDRDAVRTWFRDALLLHPWFKLLSVIFAIAMWSWVQSERVVEVRIKVPVEWKLPEKLVPSVELPETILVGLSGSQLLARNARRAELSITADLEDATRGHQLVEFQDKPIKGLPEKVRVVGLSPDRVEFALESRTEKRVRISPQVVGEPATGFRVSGINVEPEKVVLAGPGSVLADMDEIPTSPVELSGTREPVEQVVSLENLPRNVAWEEKPVVVKVSVVALASRRMLENVPVVVRTRGWRSLVEGVTVVLEGPVAELDAIRPEDVAVVVQVEDDAPRRPLSASATSGVARYKVVHPAADKVEVTVVKPGVVNLEPSE